LAQEYKLPFWKQRPLTDFGAPERHSKFIPLKDSECAVWSAMYERFKAGTANGGTFALTGKRGTGKTQLGVSLMGHFNRNLGKNVQYIKFIDLVDGLRSETMSRYQFVKPDLLVIDCIEVRKNSEFENREINAIIDKRYDYTGKVTLLISNDTKESLVNFVGSSTTSRMKQEGGIIEFNGRNFRDEK
jgi:DNA replication protein DnaC